MEFRKIRIRKKANWIQIYWARCPLDSRNYERMLALGWARYPEDTVSSKFFHKLDCRGFTGWAIQLSKVRVGYQKGTWFYVE